MSNLTPQPPSPALTAASAIDPQHVLILYASETGNAQDIAERVGRAFRAAHRKAVVLSMDAYDIADLPHEALLVLVTSTHGRGDPPPAMRELWGKLIRQGLPHDILEDVHYAIYGLGDTSYERFCYAGKMLARRMDSLGATPLLEPAWGDERAPDGYEESFGPWLKRCVETIAPYLPGPSTTPLANTELPPPIYELQPVVGSPSGALGRLTLDEPNGDAKATEAAGSTGPHASYCPPGWVWSTLKRTRRATADDWFQDVREYDLTLDEPDAYPPGAVCALHPRNSDADVAQFLESNKLEDKADEVFEIKSERPLPEHLPGGPTTLRALLTWHLDLRQAPRQSMFEWLRRLSSDEREAERLDEFLADPDEIHDYATRPKRTILETLADFRATTIPFAYVLEILPPIRRRQFSIASDSGAHPGEVQLLVALVEYKTNLSVPREGLCSAWLKTLQEGARIPLQLLPPTLFLPAPDVPVILVGPGTGVAPMRAFLEARVAQGAITNTALYFGCRCRTADAYFADDWQKYTDMGAIVRVAYSRDGPDKVYVQDLIREDAARVCEWVTKAEGHVYVCGSSNAMPRQVRAAIAWCISDKGAGELQLGEDEDEPGTAEVYVDGMFDSGRGGEESW